MHQICIRAARLVATVIGASALMAAVAAPAPAVVTPTWSVPGTAVSTPSAGSVIHITGTACVPGTYRVVLQLFHGSHAPDWVWRTDGTNQPAGLGNTAIPASDGTWASDYTVTNNLAAGTYTMTGECTGDIANGTNGFYYTNVLIQVSATAATTTTTMGTTVTTSVTTTNTKAAAAAATSANPKFTG